MVGCVPEASIEKCYDAWLPPSKALLNCMCVGYLLYPAKAGISQQVLIIVDSINIQSRFPTDLYCHSSYYQIWLSVLPISKHLQPLSETLRIFRTAGKVTRGK